MYLSRISITKCSLRYLRAQLYVFSISEQKYVTCISEIFITLLFTLNGFMTGKDFDYFHFHLSTRHVILLIHVFYCNPPSTHKTASFELRQTTTVLKSSSIFFIFLAPINLGIPFSQVSKILLFGSYPLQRCDVRL